MGSGGEMDTREDEYNFVEGNEDVEMLARGGRDAEGIQCGAPCCMRRHSGHNDGWHIRQGVIGLNHAGRF